jgi:hypothetical protein
MLVHTRIGTEFLKCGNDWDLCKEPSNYSSKNNTTCNKDLHSVDRNGNWYNLAGPGRHPSQVTKIKTRYGASTTHLSWNRRGRGNFSSKVLIRHYTISFRVFFGSNQSKHCYNSDSIFDFPWVSIVCFESIF